ncbi:MAG: phosphoribosylamine--glycine ligase [Alphaproteobacteria bacterium]
MNVLVVGGGGREHALCWKIAASPLCGKLYCAPGNAGIAALAECVAIDINDLDGLVSFATDQAIDFVVVGPEAPLVAGLVDRLSEAGIKAFGPSGAAAMLEGSKGFLKDLCASYGIPTAEYGRFVDAGSAKSFVREAGAPIVVKADGLAAGKGVVIAKTVAEAEATIDAIMVDRILGGAGQSLVIEEVLEGEEASFFALVDGETVLPLAWAQDHKRAFDGDRGPNTGGMGAYSPIPGLSRQLEAEVLSDIVRPTVRAMKEQGHPFKGVLYAGLMLTDDGPKLLEYNVRFGDPECQVMCMRLISDLLPALIATADGTLSTVDLSWTDQPALTVVMATKGYPSAYRKGSEIRGLEAAAEQSDVTIFHAGTTAGPDGQLLANGGRVLDVTAMGPTMAEARARAYAAVDRIDWPEGFCRRDIGTPTTGPLD